MINQTYSINFIKSHMIINLNIINLNLNYLQLCLSFNLTFFRYLYLIRSNLIYLKMKCRLLAKYKIKYYWIYFIHKSIYNHLKNKAMILL
jgi:hypothetical protein